MQTKATTLTSAEIRARFLAFFEKRKHTIIPSASLVTPDEKGITNPTLFNTAGMQPLIPYLLGKPFVADGNESRRLADVQKCVRTVDIDDIGDKTHATFFEMLGNWSLGDYFKKEAIEWSYEFLTSTSTIHGDQGLGLDPNRLYVTVFEGDTVAPRDDEAATIWRDVFSRHGIDAGGDTRKGESGRIFYLPAKNNWWEAGVNGPCGPDTEMFYDVGDSNTGASFFGGRTLTHSEYVAADDVRQVVEIWNDVFMQYEKKDGVIIGLLPKPSVDTGAGLERLTMTLQGVDNIYDTDLLAAVMGYIKTASKQWDLKSARIVADHMKASVFLIADGVVPSNADRGYVLRKIIRRAVRHADKLGLLQGIETTQSDLITIAEHIIKKYFSVESYSYLASKSAVIFNEIGEEEKKFRLTLKNGLKEFEKGVDAFTLFSSYGFPLELTLELAKEKGIQVDVADFNTRFEEHQALSRAGAEQKFKGGLADANDPVVVRYHTATHLLHQALHDVLGDGIEQKGSNITSERLRFDFSFPRKMTDEEKKRVEDIVNEKITAHMPMNHVVMLRTQAEKTGARHFFNEKYGEEISIYFIGTDIDHAYSKEFCGGPHVKNTAELAGEGGKARFKISKEEAVSQGVRRIKAILV